MARPIVTSRVGFSRSAWGRRIRIGGLAIVALLPGLVKRWCYRVLFGYEIGADVRIGLSLLDARHASLGSGTRIGHLSIVTRVEHFVTGSHARIGSFNIIRGGARVRLGRLLRDHAAQRAERDPGSRLHHGSRSPCSSWGRNRHDLRASDRLHRSRYGSAGTSSSAAATPRSGPTTARRRHPSRSVTSATSGSEVRLAPGAKLPEECILGIGAVLVGEIKEPRSLVAGVPAKAVRPLDEKDLARIRRKTRGDMPDDFYKRS